MKTKLFKVLLITIAISSCSKKVVLNNSMSNETYHNIEFKMDKVKEPIIPNNTVNIKDFSAVNGGQVLNAIAFKDAIEAVSKKEEEK